VCEFVDEQDCRPSRQGTVQVKFLPDDVAIVNRKRAQPFETLQQALGFDAAVRLDIARNDVVPRSLHVAGRFEHRVGLADAGGGTKNAQPPALCAPSSALRRASG
jgi:hypothetical protein